MARTAKRGAAVLVFDGTRCLAVSRGNNTEDWNLPGGHLEGQENAVDAAVRELYEETGITATKSNLTLFYQAGTTTVFLATDFFRWPPQLRSEPFEGYVSWKSPTTLCRPCCTFHKHHRAVFEKLGLLSSRLRRSTA
jgi:8-oxo-dGTP pyrophosphatase MutT (NUDIX family)